MELRQLRYFVVLAEELHFGRAAARLNLTQPPLSVALKALESELGVTLFERSSRRMVLTPIGQEMAREARAIVRRADAMKRQAADAAEGKVGSLSVGFISLATYGFLPAAMKAFHENLPGVEVSLFESYSDAIIADVEKGVLDVGYVFAPPLVPGSLRYGAVVREPLIAVLPETHLLARLKRVPVERLARERFYLFPRHHGALAFDTIVGYCVQHGFSPRLEQEARQMQTTVSLVSSGRGVALLPACVRHLRRDGVAYRPLVGTTPLIEQGFVQRADDDSVIARSFLECVRRAVDA